MRKTIPKKKILLIGIPILVVILTLFNLWWFGVFDDIADAHFRHGVYEVEKEELAYEEDDEAAVDRYYEELVPTLPTKDLLELSIKHMGNGVSVWSASLEYGGFKYSFRPLAEELEKRRNVGKILAEMYLEYPVFQRDKSGTLLAINEDMWYMEVLLAQPIYQHQLPLGQTKKKLVAQKQKEKFAALDTELGQEYLADLEDTDYGSTPEEKKAYFYRRASVNITYSDAWNENGCHWDEEILKEHAAKYIDLAE